MILLPIRRMAVCWAMLGWAIWAGAASEPVQLDFSLAGDKPISYSTGITGQWRVDGTARYDRETQSLQIEGKYWTAQEIDPAANLSYRVFDVEGEMILEDGARYGFRESDEGGMATRFDLVLPMVEQQPLRTAFDVRFNAVMEGQFWYEDRFPEMEFAQLAVRQLPVRDHYEPVWVWRPWVLPAEFKTRVPARWRVNERDGAASGYLPTIDLTEAEDGDRVRSARLPADLLASGTFSGWLPIGRQEVGELAVRPSLVWDPIRWYDADDWFERKTVRFISPLWFLAGLGATGAALVLSWIWIVRKASGWPKAVGLAVLSGLLLVWAGHAYMSGFGVAMSALVLTALITRWTALDARTRVYALTWLFMVFIDYFWGFVDGVSRAWLSSVFFTAGAWAFLLLPLIAIRRLPVQIGVAAIISAGWWFATLVGVIYFEFFRDFPSVGDLFYAGQIGELGDSLTSLFGHRHWVPMVQWGLMILIAGSVAWTQRKTQAEKA